MSRWRVVAALPVSVAVPVGIIGVAVAASGNSSDQQVIRMPTAPTPVSQPGSGAAAPAGTKPFKLFGGATVDVKPSCADSHHLGSHKAEAVKAAERLPAIKPTALDARRDFRRFLDAHPQHDLAPADFATYKSLKRRYDASIDTFNHGVDAFDHLADRYNADLRACKDG